MRQRLRILARAAATILATTCLYPAKLQAGDFQALFLDANYAQPVRFNFGGSLFFSHQDVANSDGGSGIIVGGSVGRGGMQLWGGKALLADVGTADFRAVVTRTWDNPRRASPSSTYLGGEIGWGLGLRLSVGYAKQIRGPSTDNEHIVTWGIGVEIPVWFRNQK
jgi:hypothetical protein